MRARGPLSAGLFVFGLVLVVVGFSAVASRGGKNLCGFATSSLGKVLAGGCGGISVVGGVLLLAAGAGCFIASVLLQPRHQ